AVVALLLVGGAIALVVAQAAWVHVEVTGGAVAIAVGTRLVLDLTGTEVATAVGPLAVLAMAGAFGLFATRGWVRRVLGVLLALAGAGMIVAAAQVLSGPRQASAGALTRQSVDAVTAAEATYTVSWWWPALAALGGALVLAAGVGAAARSGGWPAMGSRFDAPTRAPERARTDPWAALDRGEDPTAVESTTDLPESGLEPGTTDGGGRLR
ncbi:MAG: Trp biosynthesis-associated membrane protein, partial [Actinomycetes bacterium]